LSELPHKVRRNIANYRNRALRLGRVELTSATGQSWPAAFDALCTLHSRRWRESGQPGVLADPRVLGWHQELLPGMLQAGTARLSCLCLEGQTIGVLYSLVDPPGRARRTQYCYLIGFSPDYAELSPGSLLLALVADQAAREGIAALDMLRGEEHYKQLWHAERAPLVSATAVRQSLPTAT
jgi:CelD/BcsL family acetyltransferase involved in cellulose biosynthesis